MDTEIMQLEVPGLSAEDVVTSDDPNFLLNFMKDIALLNDGKATLVHETEPDENGNCVFYIEVHPEPKVVN